MSSPAAVLNSRTGVPTQSRMERRQSHRHLDQTGGRLGGPFRGTAGEWFEDAGFVNMIYVEIEVCSSLRRLQPKKKKRTVLVKFSRLSRRIY